MQSTVYTRTVNLPHPLPRFRTIPLSNLIQLVRVYVQFTTTVHHLSDGEFINMMFILSK